MARRGKLAIDCHAHWIPPQLASALRRRRDAPWVEEAADGEQFVTWQGRRPLRSLVDLEARLEEMERHGVELQVLSLAGLFGIDCLPAAESLPLVQSFNDGAAQACRRHPGRFAALAALPLADVALAGQELERAHALGLRGAIVPADGLRTRTEAERFRPLFEAGDRLHSHFFVHPGPVAPQASRDLRQVTGDSAWQRRIVLQTQATLSEAVFTLCLSDYLAPYPRLTVQVANLGGSIPFLFERMEAVRRDRGQPDEAPPENLARCYVDTASFGPRGIEAAVACCGSDRVVLGSDSPIFRTPRMLEALGAARLDAPTRDLVAGLNARRMIGR